MSKKIKLTLRLDNDVIDFYEHVAELANEKVDTVVGVMLAAHIVRDDIQRSMLIPGPPGPPGPRGFSASEQEHKEHAPTDSGNIF